MNLYSSDKSKLNAKDSSQSDTWIRWLVFALTGSSTSKVVKFILFNVYGIQGGFMKGPWLYRIVYICTSIPTYYMLLVLLGISFGQGLYFKNFAKKTLNRLHLFKEKS